LPTFVVGDVHGHRETLVALLRDAGLLDAGDSWSGQDARLFLLGDLVDRGPDGIGMLDLVMRLEAEAPVRCLLGNHEAGLHAAVRFRETPAGRVFVALWLMNGGQPGDLERLTPEHTAWIGALPAMARDGDWLLLHSDTAGYLELGSSVEEACASASERLVSGDAAEVDELLGLLADRQGLIEPPAVDRLLAAFGGKRIVHGHTPVAFQASTPPEDVTSPLLYNDGRVLNVDHGLYAGGPGFITELRPVD
jgi:hypothetical protein